MAIRKSLALLAGVAVAFSTFAGCTTTPEPATSGAPSETAAAKGLVGITMPTVSLERWNNDGQELKRLLELEGFSTSLEYADNKNELQIQQIENQINQDAKILVIAAINGEVLGPVLQKAADKGIKVIAYDRLIMKTPNVDYYGTFNNLKVGEMQGKYIEDTLALATTKEKLNFEPFAGDPGDNNAGLFFQGAWSVLGKYVDNGTLVINSETGKKGAGNWQDIGILEWKSETAQSEMENRLNSFYTDKKVNVVLSPNDSLAVGIAQALDSKGYKVDKDWPVLTGQDGDKAAVKNITEGKQAMTVWKDTRKLAAQVAKMIIQLVNGETVEVNNTELYNNDPDNKAGGKIVPAYEIDPEVVTADTVQSLLIDSGFLKPEEIK